MGGYRLWAVVILVAASAACSCAKTSEGRRLFPWRAAGGMDEEMGDMDAESSGEALSSSTNHAAKEDVALPKLDALAGAAFVPPPRIGHYGTVEMSYPIETPPGRAGMQPRVGLSYSSSGGDGLVGIGWSLGTGLGVIARDTRRGALTYDVRDTFTFNGTRLVKVGGPAGSENGVYRQEIESGFTKFVLSEAEHGGVWRVYDKAGTVTVYGETVDHRVYRPDDARKTYLWLFSRATDLNGNFMSASYDASDYDTDRMLYLSEIRYTGNDGEGMPARQYVRFTYRRRAEGYVSRVAGFAMRMNRLLDAVSVGWDDPSRWGGRELWRYEMRYEESADSGRPLLVSVDSTRHTTQPLFTYEEARHYFVWQNIPNPYGSEPEEHPDEVAYFEGDFNGDALSDLVVFNPSTGRWIAAEAVPGGGYVHRLYGERFRGYRGATKIQWFKGGVTGDYNGDGRSDIAFYLPQTREFWVAQHNGRVFEFRCYGRFGFSFDLFACEWFTGDFDGNGMSDVVLFDDTSGEWYFMCNRGGNFEVVRLGRMFRGLCGAGGGEVTFLAGDYSGDGRTDVGWYDRRTGEWWVGENEAVEASPGFRLRWYRYARYLAPGQALFAHDRFTGDYNGDGVSDVLVYDRERGEWWLGETGGRRIGFRLFGRSPRREVTRWLQGDFNGDGRTDVGFYAAEDGKFWIGESSAGGLRFRVYTDLSGCPDPGRILAAPLPADEVVIREGRGISTAGAPVPFTYEYNGNAYRGSGEMAVAGSFTTEGEPELLVYRRGEKRLYLVGRSGRPVLAGEGVELDGEGVRVLDRRPGWYRGGPGVGYYRAESSLFGGAAHEFRALTYRGGMFHDEALARFDAGMLEGFDISRTRYWVDRFTAGTDEAGVLVLDDRRETPDFVLSVGSSDARRLRVAGSLAPSQLRDASLGEDVRIYAGRFTGGGAAEVLVADCRGPVPVWHLGRIGEGGISFSLLAGSPRLAEGRVVAVRVVARAYGADLVYATDEGRVAFHILHIEPGRIWSAGDYDMPEGASFDGDFDGEGHPVVYTAEGACRVVWEAGGVRLEALPAPVRLTRADLRAAVYPFRWLQGDYNGDGKTDIGFFHLTERTWYFALTTGTVPDLMMRAANGIGGIYEMAYENSSSFDSRGPDGVPHLPVNYKVCTKLTVYDGLGRRVTTRYGYGGGYAFSAFIDGVKETDYFGFGAFTVTDAYGGRVVEEYHNAPFEDYRMNRALAGAIKRMRRIGTDGREYERVEYDYTVHTIAASAEQRPSFLVAPTAERRYVEGTLVETRERSLRLAAHCYELEGETERVTDHYEDAAHRAVSVVTERAYESIEATNETRLVLLRRYAGSESETETSYTYDERGNCVGEVIRYTGSGLAPASDRVMAYAYDGFGNRVRVTDESGAPARVTCYGYDAVLRQFVTEERALGDVVLVTRHERDYGAAFGAPARVVDPNGNAFSYEYDAYGRLIRERADDEGEEGAIMNEYEYGTTFPLSVKVVRRAGVGEDAAGRVYVDGMGRVAHTVRSASDGRYVKSGMAVYDAAGHEVRRSRPSFCEADEMDAFRPHQGEKDPTLTAYDAAGRVAKVTKPAAYEGEPEVSVSYEYRGAWETIETHSAGRSKRTVRSGRGLVLYVEDTGTGDDGRRVEARMGFAYDSAGRRIKKMDLNGTSMSTSVDASLFALGAKDTSGHAVAAWRYDGFGRVTETSDPDRGYERMTYTAFGEVACRSDGRGLVTAYAYDRLGRLVAKHLPEGEGTVRYTYDAYPTTENGRGRLARIDDAAGSTILSYDRLGRVKRETRLVRDRATGTVETYMTDYRRDRFGRPVRIEYPNAPGARTRVTLSYTYAAEGVSEAVVECGGKRVPIVTGIRYNEDGQVEEVRRGNGALTRYAYDRRGRLTKVVTFAHHNGREWKVQDISYSFTPRDSIAAITNTPEVTAEGAGESSIRYEYRYDGLDRLIHARGTYDVTPSGGGGRTARAFERAYSYAANGNLITKSIIDPDTRKTRERWEYAYVSHAATRVTVGGRMRLSMTYDASGNMAVKLDADAIVIRRLIAL